METSSNKIVFNTAILYAKMLITIFISLYSTRIILSALGDADYGVFNVVAGLVALLSFISITLSTSTQRYISFNLGKGDFLELKKTFTNSLTLHVLFGIIFVVCFEIIGMFFLDKILNINTERIAAAKTLYHFVVFTAFFSFISIPFDALNNSHENMLFIAVISIFENILRLLLAIYLTHTLSDKLILYGILLLIIGIIIFVIKLLYSTHKYSESRVNIKKELDIKVFKNIISFSAWNLLGVASYTTRTQGVNILLNIFWGTIVNAAYGIANQLSAQLSLFSTAMMQALQPQITKNQGIGNHSRSILLSILASKYSFILYSVVAIPFFIEAPTLLKIWLKSFPENTILFCRLIIFLTLLIQLRVGIISYVHATGRIKEYQLMCSPLELSVLPIGYLVLYWGYPSYSILLVTISVELITLFVNITFFKKMTNYSIAHYLKKVLLESLLPLIIFITFLSINHFLFPNNTILKLVITFLSSAIIYPFLIYMLSLKKEERLKVKEALATITNKIKKVI